ncbi:leucine-rich repeat-containing protein 24 [Fopius arisanus]|uniref:Leucine-rich repeat-containing protein 24 n=1 Tax=Fopius arisanus TaxID=64838 RepID=A0A9R1ST97_9HYME|nr:PREDICTED: leucine-rich repeat-containing protein 24-like [Fopius arisanus]
MTSGHEFPPIGVILLLIISIITADKCADECTCKWKSGKRTVECVNRSLSSIPDTIDPETQVLDASGNDIRALPSSIFIRVSLTNLQRLYLRGCRIQQIDKDAFAGLTNLVELDLSNNRLSVIPSDSLIRAPFLRDLSLSHNPLERVVSQAFRTTPNLVKLDLSNAQIAEVEGNGFRGLESLESLKLNGNRIGTFQPGTFEPLNKIKSVELQDNPWICNCHLREMRQWMAKHNLPIIISPVCHGPDQLVDRPFTELELDDFACRPVMMIASRYAEATIGENASIVCRVSSVPPAKVKWFWNGKLLSNQSAFSSHQKIFIYEEGQFSKRSMLILTNAQESDSSEFFCVAENRAGSVEANFTLHVSLRTAGMSTLGSGQIAGISAALVVLILFILLIILVLFVRLRRMPVKEVKNATATLEVLPSDTNQDIGGGFPGSPSSTRKAEEAETTFNDSTKPVSLTLNYVQRTSVENNASDYVFEEARPVIHGPCFSSTTSLVPIDNPDLIRDTRTSIEELGSYATEHLGTIMMEDTRLLYSSLWNTRERSSPSYPGPNASGFGTKDIPANLTPIEQFPPGAKQLRVWQKGVPVLPPVSALKRVLGSTRSSPDEGYQEGTGTDV